MSHDGAGTEPAEEIRMNKTEKTLLEHLKPTTEFADTYFCSIAKNNKNRYIDTVADKVKGWVEKNGGTFRQLSDKRFVGDRKGYLVKITFPAYNEKKQIMAEL